MKIGIDSRMYGPKQAGLGRYIEQLILNLESIDQENQYVIFLRQENWDEFKSISSNFKKVLADIPWYSWEEQIKLSKIIKQEKIDLMHFPHWNVPYFYNRPYIVTIHDLIMFHYPRPEATTLGPVKFWLKDKAHRLLIRRVVRKAEAIIAVSEFTKKDISETLGVEEGKISIVYEAPFLTMSNEQPACPAYRTGRRQARLTINKNTNSSEFKNYRPYVLYVGNAYPHKNLEGLLKAWKIFEQNCSSEYKLILIGKKNHFYGQLLNNVTMKQCNNVEYLGFVEDNELCNIYKKASLYIFPSLYEGFGLPPLEAMIYGVPVVSSNRSCLPEVLGEAALYFDPENYQQMAEIIYKGLTDEDLRFELKQNAREELQKYSWEKTAQKTLEVYNTIQTKGGER